MRIRLKGALPIPVVLRRLPELRLYLDNGVPFLKANYVNQGYTHYDVWCIGGAGGRGSPGWESFAWPYYYDGPTLHWHNVHLEDRGAPSIGGGGGGGGLHRKGGLLSALPESCAVVVGQAGVDGPPGYLGAPGPYTPEDPPDIGGVYDQPHPTFYPPQAGGDGGTSSFNGDTCRASGGKGGGPAAVWDHIWQGHGGEGGIGNRIEPGGGAAGSTTEANGSDGVWNDVVGSGGGGGRGGRHKHGFDIGEPDPTNDFLRRATSGGRGSYSYSDPSVYGFSERMSNNSNGRPVIPGAGGGARLRTLSSHGSKGLGSTPNGVVFLRIVQRV